MNVAELTDRVRRLTGIRMPDILSDDQILQMLNESYDEIMGLADWPFLYVEDQVVVNDGIFQTVPVFRNIQSVMAGDTRLRETTLDDLERYEQPDDDPFAYARIDSNRYKVWPAPSGALTVSIRGVQTPPDLYDPSDEPVFDREFHVSLAYAAASRALAEESDDSNRSQLYIQEAGAILDRMRMRYLTSHDRGVFRMGGKRSRNLRWRAWS
jgi:hypothetical protein